MNVRPVLALAGVAVLLLGGCGSDDPDRASDSPGSPSSSSQTTVPTPEQLAATLVSADTYDGTWTVNVPPDEQAVTDGVVTEDQRAFLPRIELCGKASEESRAAVAALQWQAFRQLDQTEDDPIDMAAGDRSGHLVFVQEFLMAGDPADVEATFEALRDGLRACEGDFPAGMEGPGTTEPMAVPPVGDDRFGELTTMEEAGGRAYWLLHTSWVRQGPVLVNLQVVDIVMGKGVRPVFTATDVDAFLTTAVDRLP
ncbi:hypothetical protein ASC64_16035 [Nocardioides sp. Root122]|uniref:hypothetical protein n=1 Tax=Nocardioides TaxID=1839 RepID=UPI0007029D36|nr:MULTISPECIES: hypothetical protein [Nocardioides]KQV64280.1 hypothetical protein ASC64_16035 [Nocardioides sp. Root122]MCK9824832.1 hypothetical protein [Nocardioides cavernae]